MKKFLLLSFLVVLGFTSVNAQSTSPRWGNGITSDNTGRVLTWDYKTPTFATTYNIRASAYQTVVKMGKLTAAQTDTANVKGCYAGDVLTVIYLCDTLTAGRVVTFGNGLVVSASTLTVDKNQKATISFIFDGVAWIETARAKQ